MRNLQFILNKLQLFGQRHKAVILVVVLLAIAQSIHAQVERQDRKKIIQFSGVVVGQDSLTGVPGVHVYVPRAGRGTTTNVYGYFSMPTLAGDSIVISAIGFEKIRYIIPSDQEEDLTAFFELASDTTYLSEVEIFPFPTEKDFKEAVLALKLPSNEISQDNLGDEVLARMIATLPIDGGEAYNNFVNQQFTTSHNRYLYNPNPISTFLNPFAWAELVKSIKRGDFKKKKKK